MNIRAVCTREVVTVDRAATILEAARRMRDAHVGDLVVVAGGRSGEVPVGIITDRDIAVGVVAKDVEHIERLLVEDVVELGELVTASPDDDPADVIRRMRARGVRRLPVVEGGRLIGIVSLDDLFLAMAGELRELAEVPFAQREREITTRG
ncbi:MAG: CBS domain-containing protein [Myxococcota bacterium]